MEWVGLTAMSMKCGVWCVRVALTAKVTVEVTVEKYRPVNPILGLEYVARHPR